MNGEAARGLDPRLRKNMIAFFPSPLFSSHVNFFFIQNIVVNVSSFHQVWTFLSDFCPKVNATRPYCLTSTSFTLLLYISRYNSFWLLHFFFHITFFFWTWDLVGKREAMVTFLYFFFTFIRLSFLVNVLSKVSSSSSVTRHLPFLVKVWENWPPKPLKLPSFNLNFFFPLLSFFFV